MMRATWRTCRRRSVGIGRRGPKKESRTMPFEQDDTADPIERGVGELVNAVRRGSYLDAIRCVDALARLHNHHARTSEDTVPHGRERRDGSAKAFLPQER